MNTTTSVNYKLHLLLEQTLTLLYEFETTGSGSEIV